MVVTGCGEKSRFTDMNGDAARPRVDCFTVGGERGQQDRENKLVHTLLIPEHARKLLRACKSLVKLHRL